MDNNRLEELLIDSIEWATEVSQQATHDLIRSIGITSEELEEIGYDIENFPEMHSYIN